MRSCRRTDVTWSLDVVGERGRLPGWGDRGVAHAARLKKRKGPNGFPTTRARTPSNKLLLGHCRLGEVGPTVGAALALAVQGVQIIRVHDVPPIREALIAFEATGGLQN